LPVIHLHQVRGFQTLFLEEALLFASALLSWFC